MFDKRREMKSQIFQYLSNYIEINFDEPNFRESLMKLSR